MELMDRQGGEHPLQSWTEWLGLAHESRCKSALAELVGNRGRADERVVRSKGRKARNCDYLVEYPEQRIILVEFKHLFFTRDIRTALTSDDEMLRWIETKIIRDKGLWQLNSAAGHYRQSSTLVLPVLVTDSWWPAARPLYDVITSKWSQVAAAAGIEDHLMGGGVVRPPLLMDGYGFHALTNRVRSEGSTLLSELMHWSQQGTELGYLDWEAAQVMLAGRRFPAPSPEERRVWADLSRLTGMEFEVKAEP
jgi:hypothetical protein